MRTRNNQAKTQTITVIFCSALWFAKPSLADVELPIVPASVMTSSVTKSEQDKKAMNTLHQPTSVTMTPGINELIPIAIGHLNRIVTPFNSPQVSTTSDVQTEIKGNVVYVATSKVHPVSLYITPSGQQAPALSVTLVPRRIPPREITLSINRALLPTTVIDNQKAKRWETALPYVARLRDILRHLALNQLPKGYDIRLTHGTDITPRCFQAGLLFDFHSGQRLTGHHYTVYVGVVESISDKPVELREMACYTKNVAAVAYWPRQILLPGEKNELYVVLTNLKDSVVENHRPSLLTGRQR